MPYPGLKQDKAAEFPYVIYLSPTRGIPLDPLAALAGTDASAKAFKDLNRVNRRYLSEWELGIDNARKTCHALEEFMRGARRRFNSRTLLRLGAPLAQVQAYLTSYLRRQGIPLTSKEWVLWTVVNPSFAKTDLVRWDNLYVSVPEGRDKRERAGYPPRWHSQLVAEWAPRMRPPTLPPISKSARYVLLSRLNVYLHTGDTSGLGPVAEQRFGTSLPMLKAFLDAYRAKMGLKGDVWRAMTKTGDIRWNKLYIVPLAHTASHPPRWGEPQSWYNRFIQEWEPLM